MGVAYEDDPREPATFQMPSACKCPVDNCEGRGKYNCCYLKTEFLKCSPYIDFMANGDDE